MPSLGLALCTDPHRESGRPCRAALGRGRPDPEAARARARALAQADENFLPGIIEKPLTGYFGVPGDAEPIGRHVPEARMREAGLANVRAVQAAVQQGGGTLCYAENWLYARRSPSCAGSSPPPRARSCRCARKRTTPAPGRPWRASGRARGAAAHGRTRRRCLLLGSARPEPLPSAVAVAAAFGMASFERMSGHELDGTVRDLSRALARHELELSRLVSEFHQADGWRRLGYASETQYARERLGMSRSSLVARRALALRLASAPSAS
jgi:hypothetical protein